MSVVRHYLLSRHGLLPNLERSVLAKLQELREGRRYLVSRDATRFLRPFWRTTSQGANSRLQTTDEIGWFAIDYDAHLRKEPIGFRLCLKHASSMN